MKKSDLIKVLVEEYGYEEAELKTLTNAKLKSLISQEEEDAKELESKKAQAQAKKESESKSVSMDEYVTVMSVVNGIFGYTSKQTGFTLRFTEFGQSDMIQVSELIRMRNNHPNILRHPSIVILDNDRVVNYLGLKDTYNGILSREQIEDAVNLPLEKFQEILDNSANGIKVAILDMCKRKFEVGEFNDFSKIKYLTEKYNMFFEMD